jgi:hypothetical protein
MTDAHCLGNSAGAQNEYSVMAVHAQPCAHVHVVHENGTRGSLFAKKRKNLPFNVILVYDASQERI